MSEAQEGQGVRNVAHVHRTLADASGWRDVPDSHKSGCRVSVVQNPAASLADDVAGLRDVTASSIDASIAGALMPSDHLKHGGPAYEAADVSTVTQRPRQAPHNRMKSSVLQITPAERTALQMLAEGLAHGEIATNLRISECVLDAELITLFERMGVAGRNQAIEEAVRRGLVFTRTDVKSRARQASILEIRVSLSPDADRLGEGEATNEHANKLR